MAWLSPIPRWTSCDVKVSSRRSFPRRYLAKIWTCLRVHKLLARLTNHAIWFVLFVFRECLIYYQFIAPTKIIGKTVWICIKYYPHNFLTYNYELLSGVLDLDLIYIECEFHVYAFPNFHCYKCNMIYTKWHLIFYCCGFEVLFATYLSIKIV